MAGYSPGFAWFARLRLMASIAGIDSRDCYRCAATPIMSISRKAGIFRRFFARSIRSIDS